MRRYIWKRNLKSMTSSTLASEFVTDTMGLVLRIEKRRLNSLVKLSSSLLSLVKITIYIPALVFAEILYLSEKRRISLSFDPVTLYLKQFQNYKQHPLNLDVIFSAAQITDIPELHDRLIAGTARLLNLELVTNDPVIQASDFVRAVW
jgi:predicted nucleic acid-binding protein